MRRLLLALLVVLVVLLAVNTVVMNRETEAAKAEGGLVVDLPGGDLHVRDAGPRDAPPVVLLHGYAGSMGWWNDVAPVLARDHRVITFDLLGHGGSEKPRDGYGMESQAQLIGEALDRLEVRKAAVVGHSMGGGVATALVEERRALVDSLVIVDSNSDKDDRHLPFTARLGYVPVLGQAIRRVVPDAMIRNGLESAFADGFDVPDRFVDDFRDMTYTSYDESPSASDDYREAGSLADRLKDEKVPLLVIHGSEDELVDAEAAQDYRAVPGARIVVLDRVGHSPHVENPRATTRLITDFLDRQATRARN